jgi:predicted RND superfamily exporter protein
MRVSTVGRLLSRLIGFVVAHPIWTLVLSCLLAVASIVYAFTALTLKTSQRDLLPPRQPSIQRYTEYTREFGDLEDIAIVHHARSAGGDSEHYRKARCSTIGPSARTGK